MDAPQSSDTMPPMPRPTVHGVVAMSLDGKIATRDRVDVTLSSRADRRFLNELRAKSDALVAGAGTIRAVDPPMRVSPRSLIRKKEPIRAVVTRTCLLSPDLRVFGPGPKTLLFTSEYASPAARKALETVADVRVSRGIDVAAREVVTSLAGLGARRIQVEGGGELMWSFLAEDLLDELYVTLCPLVIGGRGAPTPVDGEGLDDLTLRRAKLVSCRRAGGELFLRYRLK